MTDLSELTPKELFENFSFLENWEDKYHYLIELGDALPRLDATEKTAQNRVDGCMSQVWITHTVLPNKKHQFKMDSDAHIVRGLQAILLIHINNKTTAEIQSQDLIKIFEDLDLGSHLSGTRRNGFSAMIERIKTSVQNR